MHSLDLDEFGSPEKVAQALRRAWGIGPGPIRNLMQVIEAAGGVVILADFRSRKTRRPELPGKGWAAILLSECAKSTRVSMKNLITRAARLGCINASRSRSLYVQLSQKGYVTDEPYPVEAEYPSILPEAMRVHVVDHGYALAEISDVLGIYEDEVIAKYGQALPASGVRTPRSVQRRA